MVGHESRNTTMQIQIHKLELGFQLAAKFQWGQGGGRRGLQKEATILTQGRHFSSRKKRTDNEAWLKYVDFSWIGQNGSAYILEWSNFCGPLDAQDKENEETVEEILGFYLESKKREGGK